MRDFRNMARMANRSLLWKAPPLPKYHWNRKEIKDPRDHMFAAAPKSLPARMDMRNFCGPIQDQGQLGSCTGNAIAGAIGLIDRKNNKALQVSRLFIYYQERVLEGMVAYDAGAYIMDGFKATNRYGACLENLWPYLENKFALRPTSAAYTDAAKRKVTAYQRCANFAAVKNAVALGQPVVVGFQVYESFESDAVARGGIMPYPDTSKEALLGGHAVCIVGYDDNLRGGRFICRNSWGPAWGDGGYFYMPYQVIKDTKMSDDFWTMSAVNNP